MSRATPEQLLLAAKRYAAAANGRDPRYICNPATWLKTERWTDEPGATTYGPYTAAHDLPCGDDAFKVIEGENPDWTLVKRQLFQEIDSGEFRSWIAPLSFDQIQGATVHLTAPSTFYVVEVDKRYGHRLLAKWRSVAPIVVKVVVSAQIKKARTA